MSNSCEKEEFQHAGSQGRQYKKMKRTQRQVSEMTREELETCVLQLEAHNTQLKNILARKVCQERNGGMMSKERKKKQRDFDFSKHPKRHVSLKFAYLGWDYQGYAVQEDTSRTIESQLFDALLKTRLIESRETSNYHRCGRTDKRVSAFSQVVSLTVRCRLTSGLGVIPPQSETEQSQKLMLEEEDAEHSEKQPEAAVGLDHNSQTGDNQLLHASSLKPMAVDLQSGSHGDPSWGPAALACLTHSREELRDELDYVQMLNRVLPPEIRVLCWSPVPEGYSARFDCLSRTYKYFFPEGCLNVQAMNKGAAFLIGDHDFRNLCKMDVGNGVINFRRRILRADIAYFDDVKGRLDKHPSVAKDSTLRSSKLTRGTPVLVDSELNQGHNEKQQEVRENPERLPSVGQVELEHHVDDGRNMTERINVNHLKKDNQEVETNICCGSDGYRVCVATIEGEAFLWHQIRAIMAILFLVGKGLEKPEVVKDLLDIEKHPNKPQYCMASEFPLCLYETTFENIEWHWNRDELHSVISHLQLLWTEHSIRAAIVEHMLLDLMDCYRGLAHGTHSPETKDIHLKCQSEGLVPGSRTRVYRPLLERQTCESLERRVKHFVKRHKLPSDILQKIDGRCTTDKTV